MITETQCNNQCFTEFINSHDDGGRIESEYFANAVI